MCDFRDGLPPESRRRRPRAWTGGSPVVLADGSTWLLPRIDFHLVYTSAGLREDFLDAFRLAQATRGTEGFSPQLVRYQLHMINVGYRLLRINYDATDAEWDRLLRFDRLVDAFLFTRAVGTAVSDARADWSPPADPAADGGFSPK